MLLLALQLQQTRLQPLQLGVTLPLDVAHAVVAFAQQPVLALLFAAQRLLLFLLGGGGEAGRLLCRRFVRFQQHALRIQAADAGGLFLRRPLVAVVHRAVLVLPLV